MLFAGTGMTVEPGGFTSALSRIVRQMDDEACTRVNGCHAGLIDYAAHCGVRTKRYEVPLYRALGRHLTVSGYPTASDVRYSSGSREECDLVVTLPGDRRLWVEVKQAWKEWFSNRSLSVCTNGFYRSYLLGPKGGGLSRTHSAAQDFCKLERLSPPRATDVGFLLVGFDAVRDPMDSEVEQMVDMNGFTGRGWMLRLTERWPDRNYSDCGIACYFWIRRLV